MNGACLLREIEYISTPKNDDINFFVGIASKTRGNKKWNHQRSKRRAYKRVHH